MINVFGVKQGDMGGGFTKWKQDLPTMYSRIRTCLEKLSQEGKVIKKRQGRADYYYWAKVSN